ncbi:unnamed protein product [Pleuronectes platessa]|uniref:Uncharacterized protein n=1 Tax=Pleuronectes platessa TaxID=8262 RepID=A0A9N7V7I4_PLEPL|nr:unnamed protein product [Pleuronectes platessa]
MDSPLWRSGGPFIGDVKRRARPGGEFQFRVEEGTGRSVGQRPQRRAAQSDEPGASPVSSSVGGRCILKFIPRPHQEAPLLSRALDENLLRFKTSVSQMVFTQAYLVSERVWVPRSEKPRCILGRASDRNTRGSIAFGGELRFPYESSLSLIRNALDAKADCRAAGGEERRGEER